MAKKQTKRTRGRPSMGPTTQLAIRYPNEMVDEIDAIIADRLDRPDRASVIRELVAEALMARKSK